MYNCSLERPESCIQYKFLPVSCLQQVILLKRGFTKIFLTMKFFQVTMSFIDKTESPVEVEFLYVAVKDTIQSKAVSISRTIEMISIQLDIVPKLIVSCVYLPLNCSTQAQDLLCNVPCRVTILTIDTTLCHGYSNHFLITAYPILC